jgi:hypothetical protein
VRLRAALFAIALAALGSHACGGSRFTRASEGEGGGAGVGGATGKGGVAGASGAEDGGSGAAEAGVGGTSGETGGGGRGGGAGKGNAGTGAAGTGGAGTAGSAGSAGCDCASGQYCRAGTCRNCDDLSSIQIGDPEPLLDHPTSGLRYPRVGDSRDALFFTLVAPGRSELWYVDDPTASASFTLGDAQTLSRSGLFYVESSDLGFDVLFDELRSGGRVVMSAAWDGSTLTELDTLGPPFGVFGSEDYSVAFATETSRAYFMTTRDDAPALHTAVLGDVETQVVTLEVPVPGGGTCPRSEDDATPWVTDDGSLLVFRALPMDADCQPINGMAPDLYAAALQPSTGLPLTPAVPLAGANVTTGDATETDPSFSPDLCTLYFASDGGSGAGFDFKLFRAARR